MYNVVIIEDDPMVCSILKQYTEHNSDFTVKKIFKNSESALEYFKTDTVDLILLDYHIPNINGYELLKRMRNMNHLEDVIIITGDNNRNCLDQMSSLGITDYILKPFSYERIQLSLKKYSEKRKSLINLITLDQNSLDFLFYNSHLNINKYQIKGIDNTTLNTINTYLDNHKKQEISIDDMSNEIKLSKVTLRKYLNYLSENGTVIKKEDYNTGGRPRSIYTYIK